MQKFQKTAIHGTFSYGLLSNLKVAISFIGFLMLARFLAPEIFGQVTLGASIAALIFIVTTWGDIELIIQEDSPEKARQYGTAAFIAKTSISIALLGMLWLILPYLIPIYSQETAIFIFILAGGQAAGVIAGTFKGFIQRELQLLKLGLIELSAVTLATFTSIGMVLQGFGAWSLVAFYLIPLLATALGYIALAPIYPARAWPSKAAFKKLFSFGGNVFGSKITDRIRDHGDDFIIGSILGAGALGFYTLAYRLVRSFHQVAVSSLMPAVLPSFAKLKKDGRSLKAAFEFAFRNLLRLAIPFYLILGILAPQIIELVFGSQWLGAVSVFRWIIPFGLLFPLFSLGAQFRYGQGEPGKAFQAQGLALIIFVITMPIFSWLYGLTGAALSIDLTLLTATLRLVLPILTELQISLARNLLALISPMSVLKDCRLLYQQFKT